MNFKRIVTVVLLLILVLLVIIIVKTVSYPFQKTNSIVETENTATSRVSELSLQRLSGGIRIPTVSSEQYEETNFVPFDEFKAYLPEVYPEIYKILEPVIINEYGLVFHWKGKNPALNPILFLSHYDVVPINGYEVEAYRDSTVVYRPEDDMAYPIQEIQSEWEFPPFSGAIANGRIYGRGALDMKGMLFSILEAADALIAEGFQPERDIWFAFGHDEEVGGRHGAIYISDYFKSQNLTFDAVYDEGSFVLTDGLEGIDRPIALVGVAEKGFLTVRLRVKGLGGHSSMPPPKGSLVLAAEIIERLNENQLSPRIMPPIESFLKNVGGEMSFTARMAIANQWLLKPLLIRSLEKSPASNALIRTTTAITMANSSDAANVLSSVTEVTVNFRILQGESVEDIMQHVRDLCKDYDVDIEVISSREPSGISTENSRGFDVVKNTILKYHPDAIFSSYITIGGTDAYKYQQVSDKIYRFMPVSLNQYEQRVIHNENEYISIENYGNMISYFKDIMQNFDRD